MLTVNSPFFETNSLRAVKRINEEKSLADFGEMSDAGFFFRDDRDVGRHAPQPFEDQPFGIAVGFGDDAHIGLQLWLGGFVIMAHDELASIERDLADILNEVFFVFGDGHEFTRESCSVELVAEMDHP